MSEQPDIKILVSCHKPVCTPKNDMFIPVHVGSLGKEAIEGCQRDDEGENISSRNFTFCEMSGQYWAWKNLSADYIGQCHYRRYFCFDGKSHKANDHAQIEDECLSPYSINDYMIADELAIRKNVEPYDLVRAPYWSVKGVPTPDGPKKTIREHMVAYGLVADEAFDRLVSICGELQPDYCDELVSYLNGDKYLGYNCFIMKRQLFDRLCEFEFSILDKFDSEFSYEGLTATQKRICGYLGEVLYSVFVAHVSKEGVSVNEIPLVFFDETPKPAFLEAKRNAVNIFWQYIDGSAAELAVSVSSMVRHLDSGRRYSLTLIRDPGFKFEEFSRLLGVVPSNLEINDAVVDCVELGSLPNGIGKFDAQVLLPLLVPATVRSEKDSADPIIWLEGCALFLDDPAKVVQVGDPSSKRALNGVFLKAELNRPFNKKLNAAYLDFIDGNAALDSAVMAAMPRCFEPDELFGEYKFLCESLQCDAAALMSKARADHALLKKERGYSKEPFWLPIEVVAIRSALMTRLGFEALDYSAAYPVLDASEVATWVPNDRACEWKNAQPCVALSYSPGCLPLFDPAALYSFPFWSEARQSRAYESLLLALTEKPEFSLKDEMLPPGSFPRRLLGKLRRMLR